MSKHPIQPLEKDEHGTLRFKQNAIVRFLLVRGPWSMNSLACEEFSIEDREQFAQLIGYSLSGFSELSYVTDETYNAAANAKPNEPVPIALDVSLEKARALHRVWRALNDGDCPSCHRFHAATEIVRNQLGIECPACGFWISRGEIEDIEKLFAPAMNAAVDIFMQWRSESNSVAVSPSASEDFK